MRREILDMARSTGFEGSILDLYQMANQGANVPAMLQAEAQAKQENMLVAQTPQEQQVGLREQQAMGNIGASMVFPDVPANTSFNTEGMRVPINITKVDDQGHLVQSYQNVPPGIKDLPTGPKSGTVIETPAYQKGGFKDKLEVISSAAGAGEPLYTSMKKTRPFEGTAGQNLVDYLKRVVEKPKYYKGMVKAVKDAAKGDKVAKKALKIFYRKEKAKVDELIREGKKFGKDIYKVVKPLAKTAKSGFTTILPVDISRDASDMPALYGTGAAGDPISIDKYSSKIYKKGGYRSKHGKDPVTGTGKKPKGSGRRLYTDENPKDTVGIRFATPADARATVAKVKRVNKPFARKIQILTVGEQRAKVMGKRQVASIFTKGKEAIRRSRKRA